MTWEKIKGNFVRENGGGGEGLGVPEEQKVCHARDGYCPWGLWANSTLETSSPISLHNNFLGAMSL